MRALHDVVYPKRGGRWCGPTALAMVSGVTYAKAVDTLHEVGMARVMGVGGGRMLEAFSRLGWRMQYLDIGSAAHRLTLAAVLAQRKPEHMRITFLISTTTHWVVVRGRRGGCSLTGGKVVWTSEMKKRRARVSGLWMLTPRED